MLKKADIAQTGSSYNKRSEDLNYMVEVHVPVSIYCNHFDDCQASMISTEIIEKKLDLLNFDILE